MTGCCRSPHRMTCYRKGAFYAKCMPTNTCVKSDGWSCEVVSVRARRFHAQSLPIVPVRPLLAAVVLRFSLISLIACSQLPPPPPPPSPSPRPPPPPHKGVKTWVSRREI